jgi:hypothetical protein
LSETAGDINAIWEREKQALPGRILFLIDNIQLLRQSAEDAGRDAKQWAATSGETDAMREAVESGVADSDEELRTMYRSDNIGNATRLIDVLRSTIASQQITAGSKEISGIVQKLYRFQAMALCSTDDLHVTIVPEGGERTMSVPGQPFSEAEIPRQEHLRHIKSQQKSLSKEYEKMIWGIQRQPDVNTTGHSAAMYSVLNGSGDQNVHTTATDLETLAQGTEPCMDIWFGASTSFSEAGRQLAESFTLNQRQSIALRLICRQLDHICHDEQGTPQLCQFIGGEGGTGKSRIIEAIAELFLSKGIPHRLLVTATSGTAAAKINGITIHSACKFSKDSSHIHSYKNVDEIVPSRSAGLRIDGQTKMDWQEKYLLIIDEVSMLGGRTLYAINEHICALRGSKQDFGGIPIVLFCGDFHQFRPVQDRSILLPSTATSWDEGKTFRIEQRHQHDKAHALWKKFTTVIMLNEQVRAAGDPQLQQLLKRIRQGVADQSDVELLNNECYHEGERTPWESGITVVSPLNRNRWNLNFEATLAFQNQEQALLQIFISEHKWRDGKPTEEEAIMILNQGDDCEIPVPAIFMFVPGMPVVVNQNTLQGLKLVNGASYMALNVIADKAYPGHRISADTILHFGPPAGILLAGKTTRELHFIGMPPGTILLTPISTKIECKRKRPWQQNDVTRRGLACVAAFACTDYKVQGGNFDNIGLELRGTRATNINGEMVPSQCDPYSAYVQLSRGRWLKGIRLMSKVRERDIVGNKVPEDMMAAEERLELLSDMTIREAETWGWSEREHFRS